MYNSHQSGDKMRNYMILKIFFRAHLPAHVKILYEISYEIVIETINDLI